MTRAAVLPASRLYYRAVLPAVKSILAHTDADRVVLTVEDDPGTVRSIVGENLPPEVQTVNVSQIAWQWLRPDGPNVRTRYVYLCLLRCAYAYLFPDLDRVLCMDADAFVTRDVSGRTGGSGEDPWTLDLDGAHVAGVPELKLSAERGRPYVSAGVLLMDLDHIRADGVADLMLERLNSTWYRWVEQDVINECCRIKPLGNEWNRSQFTGMTGERREIIRHFAYEQDWKTRSVYREWDAMSWEDVLRNRSRQGEV